MSPLLAALFWRAAQLAYGLLIIAGLMAAVAFCFYMIWCVVMFVVSFIPIVGQRGRHDRWDEFNGRGREPLPRQPKPPV
jgi:hypothetical protein